MRVPRGLAYLPFQAEDIRTCLQRRDVLLSLEMGLGKTIVAIGTANQMSLTPGARVLIVCPASLKLNWAREWAKWSVHQGLSVEVVDGQTKALRANVCIINYDLLGRYQSVLAEAIKWDLAIFDESHYLKNPKAQRTKFVFGYRSQIAPISAGKRLFLTGTPILNRPVELWPLLEATGLMRDWMSFVKRYCAGKQGRWGWEVDGASNLDELQEKLRSSIMIRRLKKDVLLDLPPKRRQIIEIEASSSLKKLVGLEWHEWESRQDSIIAVKRKAWEAQQDGDDESYKAAIRALSDETSAIFEEMSSIRRESGLRKVDAAKVFLADALEAGPVVCFCHHKEVVTALAGHFPGRVSVLMGDTPMGQRQKAVDDFQQGKTDLFIGTIGAAGVGITLTRSSHVVFVEGSWVPAMISQAEDRCHRIGQRDAVLIQHLVIDGSLDAHLMKTVIEKQEVIEAALDLAAEDIEDASEDPDIRTVRDIHEDLRDLVDIGGVQASDLATAKALAYAFGLSPAEEKTAREILARNQKY